MFKSTEDTCPVHVEDGGEVVGVPVKEILGRVPGGELVTQLQHLLDGLGPHQLAQPGHGVTRHVSRVTCDEAAPGGGEDCQDVSGPDESLASNIQDHRPLVPGLGRQPASDPGHVAA